MPVARQWLVTWNNNGAGVGTDDTDLRSNGEVLRASIMGPQRALARTPTSAYGVRARKRRNDRVASFEATTRAAMASSWPGRDNAPFIFDQARERGKKRLR